MLICQTNSQSTESAAEYLYHVVIFICSVIPMIAVSLREIVFYLWWLLDLVVSSLSTETTSPNLILALGY